MDENNMNNENNMGNENNTNNAGGAAGDESLKENWKGVGKGLGKTFSGLGKTLIKTAKVGLDKADDWAEGKEDDRSEATQSMKDGWKEFGHNFVDTAEDLGKTSIKSAKKGADKVEEWASDDSESKGETSEAGTASGDSKTE